MLGNTSMETMPGAGATLLRARALIGDASTSPDDITSCLRVLIREMNVRVVGPEQRAVSALHAAIAVPMHGGSQSITVLLAQYGAVRVAASESMRAGTRCRHLTFRRATWRRSARQATAQSSRSGWPSTRPRTGSACSSCSAMLASSSPPMHSPAAVAAARAAPRAVTRAVTRAMTRAVTRAVPTGAARGRVAVASGMCSPSARWRCWR